MPQSSASAIVTPDEQAHPLVLDSVGKRYGRGKFVLRNLSYTFSPGNGHALIGPNGSGKTTLLRLLTCLANPSEGMIRYGEIDIHAQPHKYLAHVGVVHDGAGLPEHLSAVETLAWILRSRTGDAPESRIDEVLEALHLDERRNERIGTYSTGMRQKTQLPAALVARPSVLLLDEPFRGLDIDTTEAALSLLADYKSVGGLLIFSSHSQHALDVLADERLVMG